MILSSWTPIGEAQALNDFSSNATRFGPLPPVVLPFLPSTYCGSGLCVSFHLPSDEVFFYVMAGLEYIIFSLGIGVLPYVFPYGDA
jgi:hypothetical protein